MHILFGFILIVFIGVLLLGLSLLKVVFGTLGGIIRLFTGRSTHSNQSRSYRSTEQEEQPEQTMKEGHKQKKIFDKEDGEYVDFEEIKE
ncbi:MAG: DUF4834 family protein [Bacteroidia bacterium]|nr:DUF4834 family protein [Bacteroidia bacterium]